ncbi:chemotaxis protein CheA [Spongiibacter taiwanensis]|uniref:chemotaxis protein CheA n=1 Tax=Spongiibacter taiwanensis TaxID=1748242 RepID=UPI002034ACA4|nr:chemotaxis protein CheA [Spongiibacter taiwanensis]USA42755.1 chemotaxis protein CheA [Spongiibacter taiwanensis]
MALDMDMKEIHSIFFEECAEGLEIMEAGLLTLSPGEAVDPEGINTIFRAAHSIKGGAGTFGFSAISSFTHGVETLLDQLRNNQRSVCEELVEVLLASVDGIRSMVDALQGSQDFDQNAIAQTQARIDALLAADASAAPEKEMQQAVTKAGGAGWRIQFAPNVDVLVTGNEPARIFRELESLGELSVCCHTEALPDFDLLDPEQCYLKWDLELRGEVSKAAVMEAFDWVTGQCQLAVEPLDGVIEQADSVEPPSAPAVASEEATTVINAAANTVPANTPPAKQASAGKDAGSIRVSIDKIDALLNLVGELVITQSMLARFGDGDQNDPKTQGLRDGLLVLERHTRELQESAMQIRMLPIGASFSRFKRLVRDLSTKLGKKVELKLSGENTELDKTVLEKMSDPLVHLVRNSLDHGIEMPDVRRAAGKPETGTLHLSAYHEGGNIVILVEDDGAGLNRDRILSKAIERGLVKEGELLNDEQVYNLIFQPGFSTAEQVSDVSGRGVGMDVVRRNITDLGGRIDINSRPGKGSSLKIRLPLTLAILDGQLVRVGEDIYIFSLLSIVETVLASPKDVSHVVGKGDVYRLRDEYIPVISLREAFASVAGQAASTREGIDGELLVVVECDGEKMGLFVDELLEQQQVVIKSLEENYIAVKGLSGATILGDGNVALIIDVPGLIQDVHQSIASRGTQIKAA